MLHSNLFKFSALKGDKISRLLANFGVGHLNVAYMTTGFKKLNFMFFLPDLYGLIWLFEKIRN